MSMPARLILLFVAAVSGGFFALSGASVSRALDPYRFDWVSLAFWASAGLLISAPMWVPALVPNRFPRFLRIIRFFAALLLLAPTWFFSTIVAANVNRVMAGARDSVMPFVQGSALTVVCLVGIVILVWPGLRSVIKRAT
jgi:hypothetical protein